MIAKKSAKITKTIQLCCLYRSTVQIKAIYITYYNKNKNKICCLYRSAVQIKAIYITYYNIIKVLISYTYNISDI